jgi:probable F420-dependent oxidoreductase
MFSFNTDYGIRPDEMARALEERGYESFWVPEHTHIPASRISPYPAGGDLPRPYYHMADPFVSLMAAAAATSTLKLGTAISLVNQHDPIVLAKVVSTLDMLSGGRFIFGVGAGWNAEEMANHGVAFKGRFGFLEERVRAMKAIWTEEKASFNGKHVKFEEIISYPKPVQKPHPPILFGGATPLARQRVVDFCDGWIPIDSLSKDLPSGIADLRQKAKTAGRDPDSLDVSVFAFNGADGDTILRHAEMGVGRMVLVAPRDRDQALAFVDRFAEMIDKVA